MNLYTLGLILSALVSYAIMVYAWRHRATAGATPLAAVMLAATLSSLSYSLELSASNLEGHLFWAQVQYFGTVTMPVAVPALALQCTGQERWLTRRRLILLCIVPVLTLLLVWTNPVHGLIWAETHLVRQGALTVLDVKHGPLFWFWVLYGYIALAFSALILLQTIWRSSGLRRNQSAIILGAALFPILGNVLYVTGLGPWPNLDLTSFSYSLSGLIAAWGLFRYHLLDIVPIARDKVVDNLHDAVIVFDAQGRVVDLNPAAQKLLGRPSAELISRPVEQVLARYPDLVAVCRAVQETQAQIIWAQGNTLRYYDATVTPLLGRRASVTGRILVLRDVTERKQAEAELVASKDAAEAANRAKSIFLANMSHELRTPLNAILGFTQLMAHDRNLTPGQLENLEIVGRSGEHLLALINDVLELSKIETGHVELHPVDFDLQHLLLGLEEMFRLRAESKGLSLVFEYASNMPRYVCGDEGKLRQVLINLLGNAVKFTEKGGVTLRVASKAVQSLSFEIQDTGVGITPEELNSIFDAFVQTASGREAQQGTGLGLAISRQYVRIMGGELTASSQAGQGSIFRFDIRVTPPQAAPATTGHRFRRARGRFQLEPGQLAPEGGAYRLLIVEDAEANRKLLTNLLQSWGPGLEVREAVNGQEAIEVWQTWQPHLIWMDIRMPVLDGYEATRRITAQAKLKDKGPGTVMPIIVALTAGAFEEERSHILAEGCDDFVRKPFREADICDVLTRHLGLRFTTLEEGSEAAQSDAGEEQARESVMTALTLADMPVTWLAELRQATIEGDMERMLTLVDEIRDTYPALAAELLELIQSFEHKKILRWIEEDVHIQEIGK